MTTNDINAIRERQEIEEMWKRFRTGSYQIESDWPIYKDLSRLFELLADKLKHIDQQQAEIDRLRAALTKIEAYSFGHENTWSTFKLVESLAAINKLSRDALSAELLGDQNAY